MTGRVVHCCDAIEWLSAQPVLEGCSFVTSLPDVSELPGLGPERWRRWFNAAAALVLAKTPADGVAIFYQTDVKKAAGWVDKAYLVQRAAEEAGVGLVFHKIVCREPPGAVTHGLAAYAHLLAFSRSVKADLGAPGPDVLPSGGELTWVRAMGLTACRSACEWIGARTSTRTIVDPFCGVGTVLAVANELGFDTIGVELNQRRARKARSLSLAKP